jgi:release factor glutamine methyltransferase
VSNPPYVADAEMETLPPDIRLHEPTLALKAGPQGLDVISRLIAEAPSRLAPGGSLLIEISPEQAPAVTRLFNAGGKFESPRVVKDSGSLERVVMARRKS